jgi:8-oxo-dGTP diphosphatase
MSYTYEYEMPAVTVDALIVRYRPASVSEWDVEILLIRRKNEPFKGMWAFPGGFVDKNEEPVDACVREVKEETGIDLPNAVKLFWAAGGKDRDPRGWTIALTYRTEVPWDTDAKASDDAIEIGWFDIMNPPPMAFDHRKTLSVRLANHWK